MMKNIVESYLKRDLSPLQRIKDVWFSLFLCVAGDGNKDHYLLEKKIFIIEFIYLH